MDDNWIWFSAAIKRVMIPLGTGTLSPSLNDSTDSQLGRRVRV
jgi:hypothetical protein